jgi:hypothetical protein
VPCPTSDRRAAARLCSEQHPKDAWRLLLLPHALQRRQGAHHSSLGADSSGAADSMHQQGSGRHATRG